MNYEQIWAPWRLDYVIAAKDQCEAATPDQLLPGAENGCFLCDCAVPGDDRGRYVITRSPLAFTVMNKFPYNNGHLLVAPRHHKAGLIDLSPELHCELSRMVTAMVELLKKVLRPDGLNVGLNLGRAAGAGVPGHLHWHIVPRWVGDTNFMPALAGVRVIPQSLDALWEALTNELAGSAGSVEGL